MRLPERLALGLFRLAARAFPAEARERYGVEMVAAFRLAWQDRSSDRLWFTARAAVDALLAGLAERRRTHRPSEPRRPKVGSFWRDLRFGARSLFRTPGFTAVAVLTIGLCIGANAAIFSVLNAVLLQPLPFREPDRLVSIWESRVDRGWNQSSFTHANFWDLRDRNRTLDGTGAFRYGSINLTGAGEPERLRLGRVSAGFFRVLGVNPPLGRTFVEGEDRPDAPRGALLSHGLWTRRFGRDPDIVGKIVTLDDQSYPVIGVLPRGEPWLDDADVFLPLIQRPDADRGSFELNVIGRLKPEVTLETAQADLTGIANRLAEEFPTDDRGMGITVESSRGWTASDSTRRALWILMGAVGVLLLIGCVNLSNLFLARATGRSRERALRAALGASRGRLMRQVLAESLVIAIVGAGAGLLLAFGIVQGLKAWNPQGIPRLYAVGLNGWVLGFTAAVTLITALLAGLIPALHSGSGDLAGTLREGERNVGGGRFLGKLRSWLVAVEVTASMALLIGAGLLLRSFREVLGEDRGFTTENRVLAEVSVPDGFTGEQATTFLAQLRQKLLAHPEITVAAAVSQRPLTGIGTGMGFAAGDQRGPEGNEVPWASWRLITADYFRALGVPLVEGRDFDEHDMVGKPWRVMVSQRLAQQLWPGQSALGRQLVLWKGQSNDLAEIIGVVGNTRDWGLGREQSLAVYLPYYGANSSPYQLVLETRSDPAAVQRLLRKALDELDPSIPLAQVQSLASVVGASVSPRRFTMMLLAGFAAIALLLALAGIYGVLSYSVSRRTSEIGVRLAMGADPGGVLRLILRQGMQPVLFGIAAGCGAAIGLTRLMSSLLYGVAATDLVTYLGVALVLTAAGLASCYLPARRALQVDVVAALRQE